MMKKLLPIFALILAVLYFSSGDDVTYNTSHPTEDKSVYAIYATGVVEPINWARVAPLNKARLKDLLVKEGDIVEKGTLLARLDDEQEASSVTQLEATVDLARKEVDRLTPLFKKNVVSQQRFDEAITKLQEAEADLAIARKNLKETLLYAPITGKIVREDGEIGDILKAGEVIYWLAPKGDIQVTAEVDEEYIPRVQVGQNVLITADAFPDEVLKGKVYQITPKGDQVNKTYRVRVSLPMNHPLYYGMTVETNIVVYERDRALFVPITAIENRTLQIIKDGIVTYRKVKTGATNDTNIEIESGVTKDDIVLVKFDASLKEGDAISITMDK